VRACNSTGCGAFRAGANGVTVVIPSMPSSLSSSGSSSTGVFFVWWTPSTGVVTSYELQESTDSAFTTPRLAYSGGILSSIGIVDRPNGTYVYRVRACNGTFCSAYRTGTQVTVTIALPGTPTGITVPATSTGNYAVSWGAAAGTVSRYELEQASSGSFTDAGRVYSGVTRAISVSGQAEGVYFYRVRACNGTGCGAYRTTASAITVAP
jgi:hypothetical protein